MIEETKKGSKVKAVRTTSPLACVLDYIEKISCWQQQSGQHPFPQIHAGLSETELTRLLYQSKPQAINQLFLHEVEQYEWPVTKEWFPPAVCMSAAPSFLLLSFQLIDSITKPISFYVNIRSLFSIRTLSQTVSIISWLLLLDYKSLL